MDTVYRDRVLNLMRAEVEKIPAAAGVHYTLDSNSFFSDVELAVGFEVCFAHIYRHEQPPGGAITTTLYGTAEVHVPEAGLEFADVSITKVED